MPKLNVRERLRKKLNRRWRGESCLESQPNPVVCNPDISEWFKKLRKDLGLQQISLAKVVGVTVRTIKRYERGGSRPRYSILVKITEYLFDDLKWTRKQFEESNPILSNPDHENQRMYMKAVRVRQGALLTNYTKNPEIIIDCINAQIRYRNWMLGIIWLMKQAEAALKDKQYEQDGYTGEGKRQKE